MAADWKVSATLVGDSTSMERSFGNVGAKASTMAADFDKAEGKSRSFKGALDTAGEAAGGAEGKFMGTADLLDGLGGAFGLPTSGATTMFRAFGDLSGGFEAIQPLIGGLGTMFSSLGATLITPPVGIILLIGALAAALVVAYQKSETFRNIVQGAFGAVKTVIGDVVDFIGGLPQAFMNVAGAIKDAILWPYKTAFNLIARLWNDTVGQLSFHVPDWVPGIGGKGFSMPQLPTFHTGGVVGQGITPGTPMPIMALAGETVSSLAGAGGGGGVTVIVQGNVLDGRQLADLVQNALLRKQRTTPLGFAS